MVVNFRARGISRGARKLARTPTIIKKKKRIDSIFPVRILSPQKSFLYSPTYIFVPTYFKLENQIP
jgi:hypothetical protein